MPSSTDPVTAPAPPRRHRSDIQGMRGIAVLVVVLYHAGLGFPGGFVGVDMFFVISGHVITLGLLRELGDTSRIDLLAFVRRRVRRLLPPLGVMLAIVVVANSFIGSLGSQDIANRTAIGAGLFGANMVLFQETAGYFSPSSDQNPLLHTWSLSLEEQFYIGFPALLLLGWFLARRRNGRAGVVITISVMSAASFLMMMSNVGSRYAFFTLPTRGWEFGVGALTACFPAVAVLHRSRTRTVLAAVSMATLVVCVLSYSKTTEFPGPATIPPVLATAVLLLTGPHGQTARAIGNRLLVAIGDISYSWYLWHWPLIVFAAALVPQSDVALVLAAAGSLLPAVVSYRFVERRWRRPSSSNPAAARIAVAAMALPAIAVLFTSVVTGAFSGEDERFERAETASMDQQLGCAGPTPLDRRSAECTLDRSGTDRDIVVIGDSTVGMHTDGIAAATDGAVGASADVTMATFYGCPFADVAVRRNGKVERTCRTYVEQTVAALIERQPDLVVVALAVDIYPIRTAIELAAPTESPTWENSVEAKTAVLEDGLTRVLTELEEGGVEVLLVHTIPKFEPWDLTACSALFVRSFKEQCSPHGARDVLDVDRRASLGIETRAAQASGADTVDLTDALCDDTCETFRDDEWLWKDGGHLSLSGGQLTTEVMAAAIATASS